MIKLSAKNQINIQEIDSKLAFLLKEKTSLLTRELEETSDLLNNINLESKFGLSNSPENMAGKTKNQDHSPSLSEINKSQDTASNYQSSKKITAIVIDDDLDTLNFFGEYLEIKNVTVLGKGFNGKEAVQLYSKLKPDVVFLDVLMDDYDGFYALERIRWIDPSAKVIMVTADLSTKTEDRLRKLDASAVIYKPYDINQITNEIERLFQQEVCGYVKLH